MNAVELVNLTRRFGEFTAVNALSLVIKQGTIYGFLGPNGSGKSTTIRMLCGLLQPTAGSGRVLGLDLDRDTAQIRYKIGYMSQKFGLYSDLTVQENLEFYAGMYNISAQDRCHRIQQLLDLTELGRYQHSLTSTLSSGWRQRLALSSAIIHRPPLVFLDEPTGGVDPSGRRLFWDIIYDLAEQGTTVMVTTHFMDEAEHCDEIGFIYEGHLIASAPPAVLTQRLPGILLSIPTTDPLALLSSITKHCSYLDAYPCGANLHLLVASNQLAQFVAYPYSIVNATLEDVFVHLVKSQRQEALKCGV